MWDIDQIERRVNEKGGCVAACDHVTKTVVSTMIRCENVLVGDLWTNGNGGWKNEVWGRGAVGQDGVHPYIREADSLVVLYYCTTVLAKRWNSLYMCRDEKRLFFVERGPFTPSLTSKPILTTSLLASSVVFYLQQRVWSVIRHNGVVLARINCLWLHVLCGRWFNGESKSVAMSCLSHPTFQLLSDGDRRPWFCLGRKQIKPAILVDKLIEIAVDVIVPGRGIGESNWFMKNWRNLEQSTEKKSREMDMRADLRRWDQQFPELHHELIVRYLAGIVASAIVTTIYDTFRPTPRQRKY